MDRTSFSVSEQKIETSDRANTIGFGLTFISKGRKVFVSSSDFSIPSIKEAVDKANQLSKFAEEDPFNDIAPRSGRIMEYDLLDRTIGDIPLEKKIEYAMQIEKFSMEYDKRIKKASGIWYDERIEERVIANSNGVFGYYTISNINLGASILAESGGEKQEGEYGVEVHFYKRLPKAQEIAKKASSMAINLIGGQKVKSTNVPVVFDSNVSWTIFRFGIFEGAKGLNILEKTSYLEGKLDKKIASHLITLIDDGTMGEGVKTAPFDDEGVKTRRNVIVEDGILKMYLYDVYSARKCKAESTGNAYRGSYKDVPQLVPRNLYLVKGKTTPREIISEVKDGFFVINTIGFGIDSVTGIYSIGAAGRWIKDGKLTEPVSGITIASSLDQLLMSIDAVGNDLEFRHENSAPTFRVSNMTVSGI
ncbi:TldD/PmbA family protein [bacterium]|nr:TldD/PmbA family protein [bacterium]